MTEYTLIDVDSHVTEPPDTWTTRTATKYRERVPQVRRVDDRHPVDSQPVAVEAGLERPGRERPDPIGALLQRNLVAVVVERQGDRLCDGPIIAEGDALIRVHLV